MARRKRSNSTAEEAFDLFHELFLHIPAWICVPIALIVFVGARILISILGATNPFFQIIATEYGTVFAGLVGGLVLLAGGTAAIKKSQRRKLYDTQTGIDSIRNLSWREFETLIAEAYRREGYEVSETGGGGPDGGIDLKLRSHLREQIIVQCKQWRVYKVGVGPIRELFGVMTAEGAERAIFVTSGVYSKEARIFAEGKNIELVDGHKLGRLIASSRNNNTAVKELKVTPVSSLDRTAPSCPRCQSSMILRTARRGTTAGSKFWGCSRFPQCRGTVN